MSSSTPFIVIVDDTPKNLQILGTILRQEAYAVLAITDSRKALATIEKRQPDLILLDIMMPHLDGFEICSALKANPKTQTIPVIFITAKTQAEDIIKGFKLGGVDYITKPFNSDELLVRVGTQLKLQDAIKTAQKANAVKSEFLANMTHDLRSPMNSIMGVMKLMQKADLPPEQKNYINIAKKAGTSLLCLINDILDLSKIEAEQLELNQVRFDLQEVLDDIADILSMDAYKKDLDFALIIDPIISTQVIGDPERVKQIVINLLSNAIKFTASGEIIILLSLEEQTKDRLTFCISIQDTGCGIPQDKINKLFKSYTQADSSISRKYGGTGLGLSISKQLIEMMDGNITVESEENKGSTFTFTICLGKQQEPQTIPSCVSEMIQSINIFNILIIDKHTQARNSLACQFKRLNASFYEAFDSMSTMSKLEWISLENKHFDVIFIDQETFDYDIKSIAPVLSTDQSLQKTKFIILQKLGKEITLNKFFHDYLNKPVRYDKLIECLKKLFVPGFDKKMQKNELSLAKSNVQTKSSQEKVLMIDDTDINLIIAKDIFQQLGYEADFASSSFEALKKMKNNHYDIIFTDLQMPELGGIELTKIIRNPDSKVKNHNAFIVAVTASSMKQDREDSIRAGMNAYLIKPYEAYQLKDIIENRTLTSVLIETSTNTDIIFDEKLILKRLNNQKKLLMKLVENYLKSHKTFYEKLKKSMDELIYKDIQFLSHRLKGEVANLSGTQLTDLYQHIYQAAKDNDNKALNDYYQKLKVCNEQFINELLAYKKKKEEPL